ncbi:transposase family protein [Actinacidiphila glaucinigra]|uniref:transposase family protein n=1 Tax=Actinacidiphila glaucinigra TaxID=235986 RepID=UPI003D8BE381
MCRQRRARHHHRPPPARHHHAATTSEKAFCPSCGTSSSRVHSRYVRRLDDTAAGQRRVAIELQVRRFRCRESGCPQVTFLEQVSGLIFRHGHCKRQFSGWP